MPEALAATVEREDFAEVKRLIKGGAKIVEEQIIKLHVNVNDTRVSNDMRALMTQQMRFV